VLQQKPDNQILQVPLTGHFSLHALDQNGELLLAARANSTAVTLSADSTAIVLTRMILDRALVNIGADTLDADIRQAPSFSKLATQISADVEARKAIVQSDVSIRTAIEVARETMDILSARHRVASSGRASALAVVTPSLTTDGQDFQPETEDDAFVVVRDKLGTSFSGVRVEDMMTRRLRVSNTTLLDWAVNTEDTTGKVSSVLPELIENGRRARLTAATPSALNASLGYALGITASTVDLYYGPTPAIGSNLILEQTTQTRLENTIRIYTSMIDVLELAIPSSCVSEIVKIALSKDEVARLLATGQVALAAKAFDAFSISDWAGILTTAESLSACAQKFTKYDLASYIVPKLKVYLKLLEKLLVATDAAASSNTTALALLQLDKYYSKEPFYYGVCTSKDQQRLMNCVSTLSITSYVIRGEPSNTVPHLILGASLPIRVQTRDVSGKATPIPDSLVTLVDGQREDELRSNSPFFTCTQSPSCGGSWTNLDNFAGKVIVSFPLLLGLSKVEVKDNAGGERASMYFRSVQSGTLAPKKTSLIVGDETEVRLLDPEGYAIFGNNKVTWESSDSSKISVVKSDLEFSPIVAKLTAKAATGNTPVKITVRNSDGTVAGEVSVAVSENGPTHWKASHEITSCTTKQSDSAGPDYSWENPCFALGSAIGSRKGYFYFDEVGVNVVLGYEVNATSENMREVAPLVLRPDMTGFSIVTPLVFNQFALSSEVANGGYVSKLISATGTRVATYVVDASTRTPGRIQGTFSITTRSGYFTSASRRFEDWKEINTTAAGTWRAERVSGDMPRPDMKGNKYCFSENSAGIVLAEPGVPVSTPGWNYLIANGCLFN